MTAGRPKKVDPGTLYTFAHQFYWDFRRLAEGSPRIWFDQKEFERLAKEAEKEDVQLSDEQKTYLAGLVEKDIRSGRTKEAERSERLRYVEDAQLSATRDWIRRDIPARQATRELKIPGEPNVLKALLRARTPGQIQKICKDAIGSRTVQVEPGVMREIRVSNWPISVGSPLPRYLTEYAAEFIAARRDPRFPSSNRDSSLLKRLWFLSRALAGALYGVKTRTAINLVGSKRPEETFQESRAATPMRKRGRSSKKSR